MAFLRQVLNDDQVSQWVVWGWLLYPWLYCICARVPDGLPQRAAVLSSLVWETFGCQPTDRLPQPSPGPDLGTQLCWCGPFIFLYRFLSLPDLYFLLFFFFLLKLMFLSHPTAEFTLSTAGPRGWDWVLGVKWAAKRVKSGTDLCPVLGNSGPSWHPQSHTPLL